MADYTVTHSVATPSTSVSSSKTYTADGAISISTSVANGVSDQQVVIPIDSSQISVFYISSTRAVTIETGLGEQLQLVANVAYTWTTDSYDTFVFYGDFDALYITNNSGAAATVTIEQLYDSTI